MKRLIGVILALALLVSNVPATVWATEMGNLDGDNDVHNGQVKAASMIASGECGENVTWSLDGNGVLTISGTGAMDDYTRDTESEHLASTAPWEDLDSSVRSLVVENGVTTLGNYAFYDMSNLEAVTLADTLTSIGDFCFSHTWICSVEIPMGVESLGEECFSYCFDLEEIVLHNFRLKSIGASCFLGCSSLTEVTIPDSVTSIGSSCFSSCKNLTVIVLSNALTELPDLCFYVCGKLKNIEIPDTVTRIGSSCFAGCESFTEITIPASVRSLGAQCFEIVGDVKTITFKGNAPTFEIMSGHAVPVTQFSGITATAYYPANNGTWTEDNRKNYGGQITWEAYEGEPDIDGDEPDIPSSGFACRLDELTPLDYLAFSSLSYVSTGHASKGLTVYQMLTTYSGMHSYWENTNIEYYELFQHIENWKVEDYDDDLGTGFAAYTFENGYNEFVIVYRGSDSLPDIFEFTGMLISGDKEAIVALWNDWAENNLVMATGGSGDQISAAIAYAQKTITTHGADAVHITGHSLGGGLAEIVSTVYGCQADSFNAAPFLPNVYYHNVERMGEDYTGVHDWLFEDHITSGDTMVGESGTEIKNYTKYSCSDGDDVSAHSLSSMVHKDSNGAIVFNSIVDSQEIYQPVITNNHGSKDNVMYFGVSSSDTYVLKDVYVRGFKRPRFLMAYLGDGADNATGSYCGDKFVGGRGNDVLTGKGGSDKYYYFKGDGFDTIYDSGGGASGDTLYLLGFDDSDTITASQEGDSVIIRDGADAIVKISGKRDVWMNKFYIKVNNEDPKDISSYFNVKTYKQPMVISCPVDVEIVDDFTGNVVYTLENIESSAGTHDTDYGYFYVYPDDDGDYVKEVELVEGYSLRIIGVDGGDMDVSVLIPGADDEFSVISTENIPVTPDLVATVEEKDDEVFLMVDTDNDGTVDEEIRLSSECEHSYTYTLSDNTKITETCTNGCGHSQTAIITQSSSTYTGKPVKVSLFDFQENWAGTKTPEIQYTGRMWSDYDSTEAPTEAGHYTASIQFEEGKIVEYSFIIMPTDQYPVTGMESVLKPEIGVTIDGVSIGTDENGVLWLENKNHRIAEIFTQIGTDQSDPNGVEAHQRYPGQMSVWALTFHEDTQSYTAEKISSLDNFFTYKGTSIRLTGNQGIRILTAVPESTRSSIISGTAFAGTSLEGYRMVEYGTLFKWGTESTETLCYDSNVNNRSIAYGKGVDAVFDRQNNTVWFTGMLVNLKLDLCDDELLMRTYMVLENSQGVQVVIYGGLMQRNIGYVAYQNREYKPNQAAQDFIWNIIHAVYGKDFKG